eukprot:3709190-Lingulodinium_polyedra.AAC.1
MTASWPLYVKCRAWSSMSRAPRSQQSLEAPLRKRDAAASAQTHTCRCAGGLGQTPRAQTTL